MENAEPVRVGGEGGFVFDQVLRQAVTVAIVIPGPTETTWVTSAPEYDPTAPLVRVPIANVGNTRVELAGRARLTASTADPIDIPLTIASIFGGNRTEMEIPLSEALPAGAYQLEIDLRDARSGERAREVHELSISAGESAEAVTAEAPNAEARLAIGSPGLALGSLFGLAVGVVAAALVGTRRRRLRASRPGRQAPALH